MEGIELLERARRLDESNENWYYLGATCNDIGNVFMESGSLGIARTEFERALQAHEKANNERGIGNALTNLGLSYLPSSVFASALQGFDIRKALQYFLESIPIHKKYHNDKSLLNAYQGIHTILSAGAGSYVTEYGPEIDLSCFPDETLILVKQNEEIIYEAVAALRDISPQVYETDTVLQRLRRYEQATFHSLKLGDFRKCLKNVRGFLDIYAPILGSISATEEFKEIFQIGSSVIEYGVQSCIELEKANPNSKNISLLFNLQERLKARDLIKSLLLKTDSDLEKFRRDFFSQEEAGDILRDELRSVPFEAKLREEYLRNFLSLTDTFDRIKQTGYFKDCFPNLERKLEEEFRSHLSQYDVREEWLLFDFSVHDTGSHLFLLGNDDLSCQEILFEKWDFKSIDSLEKFNSEIKRITDELRREIHLEDSRTDSKTVFVIPNGFLNLIPWENILDKSTVVRSYSLDLLDWSLREKPHDKDHKGLIVCPMSRLTEDTEKEIELVKARMETMGIRSQLLLDSKARKEAVIEQMRDSTFVHLICHAFFDRRSPFESFLSLFDQERLYAYEIAAESNVRIQNVYINGCEVGKSADDSRHDQKPSVYLAGGAIIVESHPDPDESVSFDNQAGIVTALLSMGASSVLIPMSRITTAEALRASDHFYRNLAAGATTGQAFKQLNHLSVSNNRSEGLYSLFGNPFLRVAQ